MSGRRVLLVVIHLLGVGHLARMAALGRALATAGWRVAIVSGGRAAPTVNCDGCELIQLPPIHCVGADFGTLFSRDGVVADAAHMNARTEALLEAFDGFGPDVLILELYPFGRRRLAAEFEALLDRAAARAPRPAILSSIRDVLNPPSKPARAAEALDRLARRFDGVLFHGAASVAPLSASWPVTPPLARRLMETGYLHDGAPLRDDGGADGRGEVLVSGGGSAAGLPLCRTALAAARLSPGRRWRVLVGHGVSAADFEALAALAPPNAIVERARRDFRALLGRAALSISQSGYNTVLDLAAAGTRAILAPFAEGAEREQTIRAGELARRGLVRMLDADTLAPDALAREAEAALRGPPPDWSAIPRDGATEAVRLVGAAGDRAVARAGGWRALEAALAAVRGAGRRAPFWLRDDDATEPTTALDVFLARAARWNAPVALAVIPARATPELAARLAAAPRVDALVHGWAHENHAPPGVKKCEFGADRSPDAMAAEARKGLARLEKLFGDQALPVFVPPWNRIAPAFAAQLPACGYRGISTFARRASGGEPTVIRQVNAHWDPIAWKAGGGLLDEADLLDRLVRLIREELAAAPGALEPIGLLTHHLVHDGWIDRFLDEVLDRLTASGAARFLSAREVFGVSRQ